MQKRKSGRFSSPFVSNIQVLGFYFPLPIVPLGGSLKVAIDYGLQSSQVDLLASFMQALVMSEGDDWIREQMKLVATALRQGPSACPLEVARTSVRRVATHALGKAPLIADLED